MLRVLTGFSADLIRRRVAALRAEFGKIKSAPALVFVMAALRKGIPWSGGFPVRRKDGRTVDFLLEPEMEGGMKKGNVIVVVAAT